MHNNLHISLTEFRNESRVLKETNSLISNNLFNHIFIATLHSPELSRSEKISEQISLYRFSLKSRNYGRSFITQTIKYLEFSYKVIRTYQTKNIQTINIHSLALLPLGVILKKLYKAQLIYDTHELETEKNGLIGFRQKVSKFLERILIKHVDLTIVVSENIADWYMNEYKISRPTVVLNVPLKRELKYYNLFREQLAIRENQKILLYQGGLTNGRGVQLILDAFKERNNSDIVIVFMGYGELEQEIKITAQQHSNIFFYPAVNPEIVLNYTSSADVGIHLIQNTCLNHNFCMPNKIFEYAMAGLPVIVSNMKEMSELVIQNQMGTIIEDFTPDTINIAIDDLLEQNLNSMKKQAYATACNNSWETQEQKMLMAYTKMLQGAK